MHYNLYPESGEYIITHVSHMVLMNDPVICLHYNQTSES